MVNTTATPAKIVHAALSDVGRPGPTDTCVSNGMQRFAAEAGAPKLLRADGTPTASITEARELAAHDRTGWSYHHGLDGIQPGDMADWVKPAGIFHVSCVVELRKVGGRVTALRTVGSGGPTGLINFQPAAGNPNGWNTADYWQGYWRVPLAGPSTITTAPVSQQTVVAVSGDNLSRIASAHGLSLAALEALNPQVQGPAFVIHPGDRIRVK